MGIRSTTSSLPWGPGPGLFGFLLFLLSTPCLSQGLRPETRLPAFDLAARQAELVLVVRPGAREGDKVWCKVHEVLGGTFGGGEVLVWEPRNLPRPQRLLEEGMQLVFLVRAGRGKGYLLLQHPGTAPPWTPARSRDLGPFLRVLLQETGPKERDESLLRLVVGKGSAEVRALALLALCRSGGIQHMDARHRDFLRRTLSKEGTATVLRDLCARALAAIEDPGLPKLLFGLFKTGKAKGLGTCFGGVLRELLGTRSANARLEELLRVQPGDVALRRALGRR